MWLVGNIGWSEEKDCSLPSGSRCIKSKRTIRFYTFDQHFNSVREAFVLTFLKSCSKGLGECCLVAVRGGGKALFRVERRPVRSRLISENPICLIFNHKPQPIKAEAKLSKQTTLEIFNKNNLSTNYLTFAGITERVIPYLSNGNTGSRETSCVVVSTLDKVPS